MADDTNQEDQIKGITENFVKAIFATLGNKSQAEESDASNDEAEEPEGDDEKWDDLIAQAQASLSKSPAYLLVVLEHVEKPDTPSMLVPRVFHGAKDGDHALFIQSQLAHVVASFQDSTIAKIFESKGKESANEGG